MNKFRTQLEMNAEGGYKLQRSGSTVTVNDRFTREFTNEDEATQFMKDVTRAGVFDCNGWNDVGPGESASSDEPLELEEATGDDED